MTRGPVDSETLDRNWNELLQELRVTETGIQILTGFLLTVPFSDRFDDLTSFQKDLYLVLLAGSVTTTALVVTPAALHRILFRRHARRWLVETANKFARAGLAMMALTISGVLFLAFEVVVGTTPGVIAFAVALLFFVLLWGGTPLLSGRRHRWDEDEDGTADEQEAPAGGAPPGQGAG